MTNTSSYRRFLTSCLCFAVIVPGIASAQDSRFNIQVSKPSACTLDSRNRKVYSVQVSWNSFNLPSSRFAAKSKTCGNIGIIGCETTLCQVTFSNCQVGPNFARAGIVGQAPEQRNFAGACN